ncbi:membrane glycoprotein UL16 [Human betaherpesvirus 5]|nr:membrane glycoprotein UL16 [Human betaherpesvirus 5]AHJ85107.1 membrane glycoprotein UL16 [Human betaherpesvirus 5]
MERRRGTVPLGWVFFVLCLSASSSCAVDLGSKSSNSTCRLNVTELASIRPGETWTLHGMCISICYYENVTEDEIIGVAFTWQHNESVVDLWLYQNDTVIRNFSDITTNILQDGLKMRTVPVTKLYTSRMVTNLTVGRYDCLRCENGTTKIIERLHVRLGSLYPRPPGSGLAKHPSVSADEELSATLARDIVLVSAITLFFFLLALRIPQRLWQRLRIRLPHRYQRLRTED